MKKRITAFFLVLIILLSLCACSKTDKNSTFSIQFIDVGQGDAALVECDGHYMLIDGGDSKKGIMSGGYEYAGDKVYDVLKCNDVKKLDYLIISHLHEDHYGGLTKALTYLQGKKPIGKTLSNTDTTAKEDSKTFTEFVNTLQHYGSKITVPKVGESFKLGSANVEVIDVCADNANDSLVLLISYGNSRFLFTGDIEENAQKRIYEKYPRTSLEDIPLKIDLMKMPHHGSFTHTLQTFLETFMPDYVVISVGKDNPYGHPHEETLAKLENKTWTPEVYRTDLDGDIVVKSNRHTISIEVKK